MIARNQLRDGINSLARGTLAPLPLQFWEGAFPKDVIALCYHVVSDEDLAHLALYSYKNRAQFEADVRFARPRAVTYREVVAHRLHGAALPSNAFLFTFDDGLAQCSTVIAPILLAHGVDGVFFVTTNFLDDRQPFLECTISSCLTAAARIPLERVDAILADLGAGRQAEPQDSDRERAVLRRLGALRFATDQPARRALFLFLLRLDERDARVVERACALLGVEPEKHEPYFMTRDQVRGLARDGFTVGAHGLAHRSLEGYGLHDVEREIVAACELVRDLTGQSRVPFAFPYSGLAVERAAIADILRRNPLVDLVFDSGCLRRDPSFIVNRVFADTPPRAGSTNLPIALRAAWSIPSAWFRSSSS
jgi:peptidoglycan/xylan/chitin deacetylase (PgdA/CDA1 family)